MHAQARQGLAISAADRPNAFLDRCRDLAEDSRQPRPLAREIGEDGAEAGEYFRFR